MRADNSTYMPIIYVKASELLEPDGQEEFDRLWESLHTAQQSNNVQRDALGQSCVVAPVVNVGGVMGEVVKKATRRVARDIVKEQCAYELNLLAATEFFAMEIKRRP